LVKLSLSAVILKCFTGVSHEVFRSSSRTSRCKHSERSAFHVLGRHFRVLPQRLVVNSVSVSSVLIKLRGAKSSFCSSRRATQPVRFTRPKACAPSPRYRPGRTPSDSEAGTLEARIESAVSNFGRSLGSTLCAATSDCTTREHRSQRASPEPEPKLGSGASSKL
jgi:hypothetical protein